MNDLDFIWSSKDLAIFEDRKIEKAVTSALKKSGSGALRTLRTASSKEVREKKRLKLKRVNDSLPLIFPTSNDIDRLEWKMKVSGKAMPMGNYPSRQTKKGVVVTINTGKRVLIRSAFVLTIKGLRKDGSDYSHTGVFVRKTKDRYPIDHALSTRVSDVFKNTGMIQGVLFAAQTKFGREFERLLPIELGKLKTG